MSRSLSGSARTAHDSVDFCLVPRSATRPRWYSFISLGRRCTANSTSALFLPTPIWQQFDPSAGPPSSSSPGASAIRSWFAEVGSISHITFVTFVTPCRGSSELSPSATAGSDYHRMACQSGESRNHAFRTLLDELAYLPIDERGGRFVVPGCRRPL